MAESGQGRVTEAAFLQRPETMRRVELIDGEIVEAPTPSWRHQRQVKTLLVALETWARTIAAKPGGSRRPPSRCGCQADLPRAFGPSANLDLADHWEHHGPPSAGVTLGGCVTLAKGA